MAMLFSTGPYPGCRLQERRLDDAEWLVLVISRSPFRQPQRMTLHRQWESRPRFLARERHGDHRARSLIEHIMTQNQHGRAV